MVKFELRSEGITELMRSSDMVSGLGAIADGIARSLGDGFDSDTYVGKSRANASIRTTTPEAYYSNLKHNTILKAVEVHKV
jgi:hypothetical protein